MIREALWDVDGTLVDTAAEHFRAWQTLAKNIGEPFTETDFANTFGMRNPEILRKLFDANMTDERCELLGHHKETLYRDRVRTLGVDLLPGVGRLLTELQSAGIRQVVGSSAPRANVELLLEAAKIMPYFDQLVTGDDVTQGKPDPEVFLSGMTTSPRECVVFEDAVAGVLAAKAAGMFCIAVRFVGHHTESALRDAGADLVVAHLDTLQLRDILSLGD